MSFVKSRVCKRRKGNMKVEIHDLTTNARYTITSPSEAKCDTDKSAAEEAFKSGLVVTMGKVIAVPKRDQA